MENCFTINGDKIHLSVKVIPGSSKNQICEVKGNAQSSQCAQLTQCAQLSQRAPQRLKIKIAAPAEDGKANEELRSFLAKTLDCAKKDVQLISGEKARIKTLTLPVCTLEKLKQFYALAE